MSSPTELIILGVLREVGVGLAIPERQLYIEVNRDSATPVTETELRALCVQMESAREVFGNHTKDGTKWSILSAGLARLAEANL